MKFRRNPAPAPIDAMHELELLVATNMLHDAIDQAAILTVERDKLQRIIDAQPPDRDEIKAVIMSAGDAPAEIADAVYAYLAAL